MVAPRLRVLVVDDSVVIRKILTDVLATDANIEVVGVAANGKIALQKITQCAPDVITLDVEMPELNGLETLRELRKSHSRLPVIMFSTLTERGAAATLDALSLGASDYCTKPSNVGSVAEARERVKNELLAKIYAVTGRAQKKAGAAEEQQTKTPSVASPSPGSLPKIPSPVKHPTQRKAVEIVAIGVSTGGPNALSEIVPQLAEDFPVPIVCVQHMPPLFTQMLAERLDKSSRVRVGEGKSGDILAPGNMYLAPGGKHMVLRKCQDGVRIELNEEPPENSCRPAVDPLFRTVDEIYGAAVLGVILTGMGSDGLRGCEAIKHSGGTVFAQDRDTSVVWGMPGYVAERGLADRVLALGDVAREISDYVIRSRAGISRKQWG